MGYTLDSLKYGVDSRTWSRAVELYNGKKVTQFHDNGYTCTARVRGTALYRVIVSKRRYTDGDCDCYLGQHDTLCKHMIAVAVYALQEGKPLSSQEAEQHNSLTCSGVLGTLGKGELSLVRAELTGALRYIKSYSGPSRTWFAYQDSLTECCNRLSAICSRLPISSQTADLVIKMILRLDDKLQTGGVDDSDGTVGGFIEECVDLLIAYSEHDRSVVRTFSQLADISTCFGWEERLTRLTDTPTDTVKLA